MNNGIRFLIFLASVALVVFLNLVNFWGLVVFGLIGFITLIYFASTNQNVRSWLGWFGWEIGGNNNYRLYSLAVITLLIFIAAAKYGGGEPIFLSSLREFKVIVSPYYTSDRQKSVNTIIYGADVDNETLANAKKRVVAFLKNPASMLPIKGDQTTEDYQKKMAILSALNSKIPTRIMPMEKDDTPETYNEKIKNLFAYGVFLTVKDTEDFVKLIPAAPRNLRLTWYQRILPWNWGGKNQLETPNYPRYEKSWFLWKVWFIFLLITIAYIPFAYADEAASLFRKLYENFTWKRELVKSQLRQPLQTVAQGATVGTTAGTTVATGVQGVVKKVGWLYSSDLAAEFTMKILEKLIRFFTRG